MFNLPLPEMIIFASVVFIFLTAAIVGLLQLLAAGEKYKRILLPLVSLGICLEAVFLIVRAVEIKAVPLTGLFESMIVLTIVFGLVYLFFSIAIQQVWFGSVMVWVIFALILLAAIVAEPATELQAIAETPWAIAHGITMILGGASVIFATASSFLYLLGNRRLKLKKITQVLGRVPNIEKLEQMTLFGIRTSFVLVTIGIISGLGLVFVVGTGIAKWLTDVKVICIFAAWILLGIILILNHTLALRGRTRAYLTILVFAFILIAIIGVTISGTTQHDFSGYQ
jgi:ABC-type uncharacterized transport system permease subunit